MILEDSSNTVIVASHQTKLATLRVIQPEEHPGHTVLWQLYIENQKQPPNFWIYEAFLLDKQLSIWRFAQN